MNTQSIRDRFIAWVTEQSGRQTGNLHPLVHACLDDAIDNLSQDVKDRLEKAEGQQEKEIMKEILDYWSSNVYMIVERGIATDGFRGIRMPIPQAVKTEAMREFYSVRNAAYAKYFG